MTGKHVCSLPDLGRPLTLAMCPVCGRRYIRKHFWTGVDAGTADPIITPRWVQLKWWQRP